jgi:hypothetical protein
MIVNANKLDDNDHTDDNSYVEIKLPTKPTPTTPPASEELFQKMKQVHQKQIVEKQWLYDFVDTSKKLLKIRSHMDTIV